MPSKHLAMIPPVAEASIVLSECFGPTIQGEGALIGKPTVFVRTGGCDYRCIWCDSLYAVLPEHKQDWISLSTSQAFSLIQQRSQHTPLLVTISGGNPAIQPLEGLLDLGHTHGYTFALETQGSVARTWFSKLDYLTLSPKPPSSNHTTHWKRLDQCIAYASEKQEHHVPHISLKIVVFDESDYLYACTVAERYPNLPLYLQVGNHTPPQTGMEIDTKGIFQRMEWLLQRIITDQRYTMTLLPQLHTLLWGNTRGV